MFISPSDVPQLPSVSLSPSGEIVEGISVTLTCSSDANPAANYTWYKKVINNDHKLVSKDQQLVFSSIQSSDSGEYYCTAENELGKRTSEHIFIDVKCEKNYELEKDLMCPFYLDTVMDVLFAVNVAEEKMCQNIL